MNEDSLRKLIREEIQQLVEKENFPVFSTKKAARSFLNNTFTKELRDRHTIVSATRNGKQVGWMLQINTSNKKKY